MISFTLIMTALQLEYKLTILKTNALGKLINFFQFDCLTNLILNIHIRLSFNQFILYFRPNTLIE